MLLGALARDGQDRLPWAGFAATGSIGLALCLAGLQAVGGLAGPPQLLAAWVFHLLLPYINPTVKGGQPYIN